MPMNDLGNESRHAAEYLEWFGESGRWRSWPAYWPFLWRPDTSSAATASAACGKWVVNLIWSGLVGGAMAVGAVALLPLAVPDPTRGMEIGVAVLSVCSDSRGWTPSCAVNGACRW